MIFLEEGWNLISFPVQNLVIGGVSITNARDFTDNTAAYIVADWNQGYQRWNIYGSGVGGTNFDIIPDKGYAVYVFSNSLIRFNGDMITESRNVNLVAGWNVIGYTGIDFINNGIGNIWAPQVTCTTPEGVFDDIGYWDFSDPSLADGDVEYFYSTDIMDLMPGRGYWVWSDIDTNLVY